MKQRVLGIILSILGISGLIVLTIDFMNGGGTARNVIELFLFALAGAIFFFGGLFVHHRASEFSRSLQQGPSPLLRQPDGTM